MPIGGEGVHCADEQQQWQTISITTTAIALLIVTRLICMLCGWTDDVNDNIHVYIIIILYTFLNVFMYVCVCVCLSVCAHVCV